jgi:hypothetical protein
VLANFPVPPNELREDLLTENREGAFYSSTDPNYYKGLPRTPIKDILSLPAGSEGIHASFVAPVSGVYVSQPALHYLGIFLLSTLVRYRPRTWVHAITRTATSDTPADDQALTLIESFMSRPAGEITSVADHLLRPPK